MLALCAGILCSCAAAAKLEPKKYDCGGDGMRVVSVDYGGIWGPLCVYKADGIHACREVYRLRTDKKTSVTTFHICGQQEMTPKPDQWRIFWAQLEALKVSRWRSAYRAKDIGATICDGLQWSAKYTTLRGSRESGGDNAFPSTSDPGRITLDQAAFDRLVNAYAALFPTSMDAFVKAHR